MVGYSEQQREIHREREGKTEKKKSQREQKSEKERYNWLKTLLIGSKIPLRYAVYRYRFCSRSILWFLNFRFYAFFYSFVRVIFYFFYFVSDQLFFSFLFFFWLFYCLRASSFFLYSFIFSGVLLCDIYYVVVWNSKVRIKW